MTILRVALDIAGQLQKWSRLITWKIVRTKFFDKNSLVAKCAGSWEVINIKGLCRTIKWVFGYFMSWTSDVFETYIYTIYTLLYTTRNFKFTMFSFTTRANELEEKLFAWLYFVPSFSSPGGGKIHLPKREKMDPFEINFI